jgi:hypothetical protein
MGIKTTITATIYALVVLGLVVAMMLDKITFQEFKDTISVTTPIAVMFVGWFAKDQNKTHSNGKG